MSAPDSQPPTFTTPEELALAIAQQFLNNALAGRDATNDEMIAEILAWQRERQQ